MLIKDVSDCTISKRSYKPLRISGLGGFLYTKKRHLGKESQIDFKLGIFA